MRRVGAWLGLLAVVAIAAIVSIGSPLRRQVVTGAGLSAKQLCSLRFVSGIDAERARELFIDPQIRRAAAVLRFEIDESAKSVTVSLPGIVEQHAIHRDGYGCTLRHGDEPAWARRPEPARSSQTMSLARRHRDAVFDTPALEAAVDAAFLDDRRRRPANTLAVVVLHDGKLVAERYADGIAPDTRLPGWSMTKSATATVVGVLAQMGIVDVHAPGAIREWRNAEDPRAAISLDHLLRMTSGLLITELANGNGLDPTSILLYHEPDAAAYAASRRLAWAVGRRFEYMSGSSVLAMRAAQEAIGAGPGDALAFIRENLFDPLGMDAAIIEPDSAGTLLGSSSMFASARDWARLGGLYVRGGTVGARRLLSREWISYVTTPTRASRKARREGTFWEPGREAYGAGFWLLPEAMDPARDGGTTGLPGDAFDANGFQGQYLWMIPSKKLVVVRMGATNYRGRDHDRLPREVIAAMK